MVLVAPDFFHSSSIISPSPSPSQFHTPQAGTFRAINSIVFFKVPSNFSYLLPHTKYFHAGSSFHPAPLEDPILNFFNMMTSHIFFPVAFAKPFYLIRLMSSGYSRCRPLPPPHNENVSFSTAHKTLTLSDGKIIKNLRPMYGWRRWGGFEFCWQLAVKVFGMPSRLRFQERR